MTTIMSIKCTINDYGAFKQVFDASDEIHAQVGIIGSTVRKSLSLRR